MRSQRFINSLLYAIIQLIVEESRANKKGGGIMCFLVISTLLCSVIISPAINAIGDICSSDLSVFPC